MGGDRDNVTVYRSWAVSTSVSLRRYDVSGGTETVILTGDNCNVRHRGLQVHELMCVARERVDT